MILTENTVSRPLRVEMPLIDSPNQTDGEHLAL